MTHSATTGQGKDLRETNRELRERLRNLTREANHNETVMRRFHERELTLLSTESLPQLLSCLVDEMKSSFELPCIRLILHDPNHELRHLLLHAGIEPQELESIDFLDDIQRLPSRLTKLRNPALGAFLPHHHLEIFPNRHDLKSVAILPMLRRSQLTGFICFGSQSPDRFTRHHASDFLSRLSTIAAICLENTVNREHLVITGLTDALTGLHNRRYLESRLEEEITRALRYHYPLSCLFIDADHFKRINDNHGHGAGDAVLRELALRVKECLRASDVATRYGGEEFALLLPQTTASEAVNLAERIRGRIGKEPIAIHGGQTLAVTVSVGVSALCETGSTNQASQAQILLETADQALYRAKESGRNRVVLLNHAIKA